MIQELKYFELQICVFWVRKSENLITTDGLIGTCRGVVGWGEDGIKEGGSGDGNGGGDGSACIFSILLFKSYIQCQLSQARVKPNLFHNNEFAPNTSICNHTKFIKTINF